MADTLDELRDNLIEAAQCWLLTSADMENYRRNDRRRWRDWRIKDCTNWFVELRRWNRLSSRR